MSIQVIQEIPEIKTDSPPSGIYLSPPLPHSLYSSPSLQPPIQFKKPFSTRQTHILSINHRTIKMCNWETYLYQCGCFDVRFKSQCHYAHQEGRRICSVGQVVKGSWCYAQPYLCGRCRLMEQRSGRPVRRFVPAWEVIGPLARSMAESKARAQR